VKPFFYLLFNIYYLLTFAVSRAFLGATPAHNRHVSVARLKSFGALSGAETAYFGRLAVK
jgi:hypothetical protein